MMKTIKKGGLRYKVRQTQTVLSEINFLEKKTVYYQVKVLMVNRIARSMLMFGKM